MLAMSLPAQTMQDVIKQMPDSLLPYLTNNNRLDMIDFINSKMNASVDNLLGEKSEMTALTDNFAKIKLSESSSMELKLLSQDSLKIICMVRTYSGPQPESTISFFSSTWQPLNYKIAIPSVDEFLVKPDTMSIARFTELKMTIDPAMVSAQLSPDNTNIIYMLSEPLLSKEDKTALKKIIRPIVRDLTKR